MTLESILHVPNLSCNFLSISKLARDMNCVAKIFPSYYEFQDLCSRRTIGSAKEIDGLYYLVEDPIKSIQAQVASNDVFSFSIEHQIML